jgi:hypothetical protein
MRVALRSSINAVPVCARAYAIVAASPSSTVAAESLVVAKLVAHIPPGGIAR